MSNDQDDTITAEVDSRLDDIFVEDEEKYPIRGLKEVVLSLDWEINDENVDRFLKEIENLKEQFKEDKILFSFLKMLAGVGKYLNAKRADSHPETTKLLSSVYFDLEKVIGHKDLTELDKKRILNNDIKRFKKLKEDISMGKAAVKEAPTEEEEFPTVEEKKQAVQETGKEAASLSAPGTQAGSLLGQMTVNEAIAYALEDIKKTIKSECSEIRKELLKLRQ